MLCFSLALALATLSIGLDDYKIFDEFLVPHQACKTVPFLRYSYNKVDVGRALFPYKLSFQEYLVPLPHIRFIFNFCTREGYLTGQNASFSALMSLRTTNTLRCFTSGSEKLGSVLDFYQFQ